jgi:NTE family protein
MAKSEKRPPFECVALTLQGGGALGAYQAGVYEALAEADVHPDWVAGISIGSINAAIIAGNPPEARVAKLKGFWDAITSAPWLDAWNVFGRDVIGGDAGHKFIDQMAAGAAMTAGVQGFFKLRMPPPYLEAAGSPAATSFYDTAPLAGTLARFVDFDRINAGETRLSVGAVNVGTGNFVYFDSTKQKIGPEHIMASGALPPGFPAIEIDGEYYWDGGLVSNTPLQWVLEFRPGPRQDTLVFEVDLWSAQGRIPRTLMEVATREKEIRFSSRTRDNTDRFEDIQCLRHAIARLIAELPPKLEDSASVKPLKKFADSKVYNIVHLIYRSRPYEGDSKDYEFSQLSMRDHWAAGHRDTVRTLRHPEVLQRPRNAEGIAIYDFAEPGPG